MTVAARDTRIEASTLGVRSIGPWLRELLTGLHAEEADILFGKLELAVHEICMNSVDHAELGAQETLRLNGVWDDDSVQVTVEDAGRPFQGEHVAMPEPGVPQIRGYGLLIVRRIVDRLDYRREDDRNRWTITLYRHAEGPG